MEVAAVVTGIQTGEETKGAAVEWLSQELEATTVLRNGGCQAGHHIVKADGREQMFSHFGAATFDAVRTYLRDMVIDPVLLFREAEELETKGVSDALSLMTVDENCLTITPFHGAYSRLKEMLRDEKKGTVGMGVGDAVTDMRRGVAHIRAKEFGGDEILLSEKIESIRQHKIAQAVELISALTIDELCPEMQSQMEILHDEKLVSLTATAFHALADLVKITNTSYFEEMISTPGALVAEPSHGALLHPYAFAPHTTQVDPTSEHLITELKQSGKRQVKRIGVGRCYMTRHGSGPLVSFDRGMTDQIHETHNAANAWANEWLGEFRSGHFDLIATQYALKIAGGADTFDGLMLSYLDVLNAHERWGVVEGYRYTGNSSDLEQYFEMSDGVITRIKVHADDRDSEHLDYQLRLTSLLKECQPIVKYLEADEDRSLEEVFLQYVEQKTGIPVIAVSRGPRAEDREKRESWNKVFDAPKLCLSQDLYEETESTDRRDLSKSLSKIFANVSDPTMDFDQAINENLVNVHDIDDLYRQLSHYLTSSESARRLVLYLPLQLLPHHSGNRPFHESTQSFVDAYLQIWKRLLYESDPRASFVDGDLLEPGMGEPERVRKAAHLIPDLLAHKLVSITEIESIVQEVSDMELHHSIYEGLMVARDRDLISDQDWSRVSATLLCGGDQKKELSSPEAGSPARQEWLSKARAESSREREAKQHLHKISNHTETIEDVIQRDNEAGVLTLDLWVQHLHKADREGARTCAKKYQSFLQGRWNEGERSIRSCIDRLLNHWEKLNIIDREYLHAFGQRSMDRESSFHFASEIARKIEQHPVLSQVLYPLVLAVGSRVKGYASATSDFDGGIVFRPETPWQSREEILSLLRRDIPEMDKISKALELWLSCTRGEFGIKASPQHIQTVVNPSQVHFLLNGLWIAAEQKYMDVPRALLEKYRDLSRFGDQENEVRHLLTRQLEADTVQFRLMHSGYRYHYPSIESNKSTHADMIDGSSTYWDPGYRRVATQLFIQKVYVPQEGKSYDRT